jgi:hypothetical protein
MGEARAHLGRAYDAVAELRSLADGHHLEQPWNDPALPGPTDELVDLAVVLVANDDRVELDLVEAGSERGVDAGEDDVEATAARHPAEAVGVERVERHIDPVEPGVA